MSLLLRLGTVVFGILLVSLAVGAYGLVDNVRRAVSAEMNSSLELTTTLLQLQVDREPAGRPASLADWRERLHELRHSRHLRLSLVAPGESVPVASPAPARVPGVPGWFVRKVSPQGHELVRHVPLGDDGQVVVRADPADEITEAWGETRLALLTLGGFGSLATALVCLVLWRALAPLAGLARALQRFEAGDYDVRLMPSGVPDVDRATESFNHMAGVLSASRSEMARLAQEALAIREEERRHLAQELHDGLGQSISAIKALAVSIERKVEGASAIATSAAMIANVSTDIYEQVRSMMARLRPSILDELGLISALATMIDDWNSHHEDQFCSFEHQGGTPRLSTDTAINVFRIVQEALTNVVKHAGAASVSVRLLTGGGECTLQIEDDGQGFEPASVRRGLGLLGIEERVRAMRGRLSLATAPGRGTKFVIVIPHLEYQADECPDREAENSAG